MTEQQTLKRLGRYEIVRELGRGAMGIVYEGHDPVVGRRVAIKTARRDVIESSTRADELMARFLREARAAGALNHPNIVTIYDAGEENAVAYIAMEFLEGTDLQKVIETQKRFETPKVLEITSTVCTALQHAHDHGVVHRDIKPSNIVLLANGTIKVADFGIARVSDSQLTQEGSVIGTPHYMSPEQFMGHPVDGRSDIFSVGIIVYEMLTGEKPFHGKSLSAVMHNVLHTMPVPPRDLNFGVSDCLSRVVMKALAKDPRDRYQSADAMAAALRECTKECPDPAVLQIAAPATDLGATVASGVDPQATAVRNPEGTAVESGHTAAIHPADAFKTVSSGSPETVVAAPQQVRTEPETPRRRWGLIAVLTAVAILSISGVLALPFFLDGNGSAEAVNILGGDEVPATGYYQYIPLQISEFKTDEDYLKGNGQPATAFVVVAKDGQEVDRQKVTGKGAIVFGKKPEDGFSYWIESEDGRIVKSPAELTVAPSAGARLDEPPIEILPEDSALP